LKLGINMLGAGAAFLDCGEDKGRLVASRSSLLHKKTHIEQPFETGKVSMTQGTSPEKVQACKGQVDE
jgi:hypothetical protein